MNNPFTTGQYDGRWTGVVTAEGRARLVETFSAAQCEAALHVPGLQKTVIAAIRRRQKQLFENGFRIPFRDQEDLKRLAAEGKNLAEVITMIAHWSRQREAVPFSEYAAHWTAAQQQVDVQAMRELWPLSGTRMIADNCSDWGSVCYERKKQ